MMYCTVLYLLAKLEHGVELQHLLHGEGQLGAAPGAAGLARRSEDYKMKNVTTVKIILIVMIKLVVKMIKYYYVTHIG